MLYLDVYKTDNRLETHPHLSLYPSQIAYIRSSIAYKPRSLLSPSQTPESQFNPSISNNLLACLFPYANALSILISSVSVLPTKSNHQFHCYSRLYGAYAERSVQQVHL